MYATSQHARRCASRGSFCYPRGVEQPEHLDLAALRGELARRAARLVPKAPVGAVLGHQQARHDARVARLRRAVCGRLPSPLGMAHAQVGVGARLEEVSVSVSVSVRIRVRVHLQVVDATRARLAAVRE